jgi:glycosyltransferase involved in cell wall biosynthesis
MRVVVWGTYDTGKPRIRIFLRGLKESGVEVIECHKEVWGRVDDKSQVRGLLNKFRLLFRWLLAYPLLIFRYLQLPRHDVVLIGYMGHLDVLVLRPFASIRGVPVVWDAFLSLYNTVVEDRRMISERNPLARLLWLWEWLACQVADRVVLDTRAHADYFVATFHLPRKKTESVFVGAEPEAFPIASERPTMADVEPIVLFYGQFIPLHGIETIILSARAARDEPIAWVIIGSGQDAERVQGLIDEDPIPRLKWIPWVNYLELTHWISRSAICLGIFGDTDKAARVIPNKAFQILMSGKPLVTRDSAAIRELVEPGQPGIWLVPPADPDALMRAVREAVNATVPVDLHAALRERISPHAIGLRLLSCLNLKTDLR